MPATPHLNQRLGFAVVDVETTGLNADRHRVIEVAVTQVNGAGEVTAEWSSLVRTQGDTGPVHIHGLTAEHVREAPAFSDLAPKLAELLSDRILVAHNAEFDWAFLCREAARVGLDLPVSERLCTVRLAQQLKIDTPNYKLATLAEHWGIDAGTAHRAADDVRTLAQVLSYCLQEAGRQGAPLPLESCEPPTSLKWKAIRTLAHLRNSIGRST